MEPTMTTSLLIGFDVSGDDKCVLIVGKKTRNKPLR